MPVYLLRWNLRYLRMLLVGMKVQDMQARIFQLQRFPGLPGCGGRVVCLISWQKSSSRRGFSSWPVCRTPWMTGTGSATPSRCCSELNTLRASSCSVV